MPELRRMVIAVDIPDQHLSRLRHEFPGIAFDVCPDQDEVKDVLPGAQALLGGRISAEQLALCPELSWIHTYGTGVDALLFPELIESDITVTNSSGVQASSMAEHLLAMMLAFARGLPDLVRHQAKGEWIQPLRAQARDQTDFYEHQTFELGEQTLAIVGLGSVGRALAVRAKALGMRVLGIRRQSGDPPQGVDRLFEPDAMREMLTEADHIAVCLPLTSDTRRLFDGPAFRAMKPGAYFYNVGRGELVDQDALIHALQQGEIAGAGLDVTTPEPLPSDSPLWYMPNVLITSHTSGLTPHRWDRVLEILSDNIRRYRADEPMRNVVDKRAGY